MIAYNALLLVRHICNIYATLTVGSRFIEKLRGAKSNFPYDAYVLFMHLELRNITLKRIPYSLQFRSEQGLVYFTLLRLVVIVLPHRKFSCNKTICLLHRVRRPITPCTTSYYIVYGVLLHSARRPITPCTTSYYTVYDVLLHRVRRPITPCTTSYYTVYDVLLHRVRRPITSCTCN